MIAYCHAVADPYAMMVHSKMAASTDFTVVAPRREDKLAKVAEEELAEVREASHLFFDGVNLFLGRCGLQLH